MLEDMTKGSRRSSKWNAETASMFLFLLSTLTMSSFIVSFVITSKVMSYNHALTISLQSSQKDICKAYQHVASVVDALKDARANADEKHQLWWQDALALAEMADIQISKPRTCGGQQHRSNMGGDNSVEAYWRICVTLPLLDEIISHSESRFADLQSSAAKGLSLLPEMIASHPKEAFEESKSFANAHDIDLPPNYNLDVFSVQLEHWHKVLKARSSAEQPTSITEAIALVENSLCPAIARLLQLVACWPVATCGCERSVSALRRLKTYLGSTLTETRLSGLALLHVYGYVRGDTDKNKVVQKFCQKRPRQLIVPVLGKNNAA